MFPHTELCVGLLGLFFLRLVLQAVFVSACGRFAGAAIADMILLAALVLLAQQAFFGTGFLAEQVQDVLVQLTAPVYGTAYALNGC